MGKNHTISIDDLHGGLDIEVIIATQSSGSGHKSLVYNPLDRVYTVFKNGIGSAKITDKGSAVRAYYETIL